eukprot:8821115-Pyramimonas_sp.AAC.1
MAFRKPPMIGLGRVIGPARAPSVRLRAVGGRTRTGSRRGAASSGRASERCCAERATPYPLC